MLVCNVSIRPQRSAIAADLVEAAAAADLVTFSSGFAALLDEPVSASDTLSAFVGHIMVEAASASDAIDVGATYGVAINEPAAAVDSSEAIFAGGIAADVVEAATATDDPSAVVVAAPSDDWTLIDSWTYSTPVAQVDFIGLAGYTEVRVLLRNVASSVSGVRAIRVSINNGSTFMSSTGDYILIDDDGNDNTEPTLNVGTTPTTAARSGELIISGWNLTAIKIVELRNIIAVVGNEHCAIIPTTSALNALRIHNSAGGNLTSGSIYVFAR